jgi:isoleucyl-tRNA synthetase
VFDSYFQFEIALDNLCPEEDPAITINLKCPATADKIQKYKYLSVTTTWTLPANRALVVIK